ncbi:hypothetical protein ACVU7I_02505 [Patulibacter sp. S7RM1-6]
MLRDLTAGIGEWVRRIPRGWRYAGAAALVLVLALAVFRGGSDEGQNATTGAAATAPGRSAGAPAPEGAVMLRRDGAAVLGVLRTDDGAAAAALSYTGQRNALQTGGTSSAVAAEVGGKLALGGHDIGKRPASIPDRAAEVNATAMLATRQGTLKWLTLPIAYRVRSYTPDRAVVRVFSAALNAWASPDQGSSTLGYSLRDLTLDWANGAWRIRSVVDTPDQPTPALVATTNSSAAAERMPLQDRVIQTSDAATGGLYAWLQNASTVTVGPQGMGPVAGNAPAGPDAALLAALASGYAKAAAKQEGPAGTWTAGAPIAYHAIPCPSDAAAAETTRCYEVLAAATSLRGRGIALTNVQLAGLAVSTVPGQTGSVKFDISEDRQREVLGDPITIASAGLPDSRTTNAAWRRSAVPLAPTVPAVPR